MHHPSHLSDLSFFAPGRDQNREAASRAVSRKSEAKWHPGLALLFTASVSLALWSGIGTLVWFVIRS